MAGWKTGIVALRGILAATPKSVVMAAAAAMFAGAATIAGGDTLAPRATNLVAGAPSASFAERFSGRRNATDCAARNWPYLGVDCLRMVDGSQARAVRIIAVDRQGPVRP